MRTAIAGTALLCWSRLVLAQTPAPAVDPAWLAADAAAKRVTVTLTAGLTTENSGLNFNGFKNGALTVTVPKGWTVAVRFTNHDPNLTHSALIIPGEGAVPVGPVPAAFAHAETKSLEAGLAPEAQDDFTFVADKAGMFRIFCAVPGHGAAGMWIRLQVSATATEPKVAAS